MAFLLGAFASAAPFRTTYQAKIIKPDGQPLQASSVNFKFTILDPAATCVIYSEDYTAVNMHDSGGVVAFSLGAGVRSFPTSGTAATFSNIFDNSTPSFSCQTLGVYLPTSNDGRKIVMQFNDGTGWQTLPAMTINAVPYSMYAGKSENSIQLNGKFDTAFVEYSSLAGLNCQANEAIHFNGVSFSCLAVGGGSVTSGSVVTALGYTPADAASFTTLSNSLSTATTNISSLQSSVAASFSAITSSQWLTTGANVSYNSGNVGIGTSHPVTRLEISNGLTPLTANLDAISISAFNDDWGYPVSATIGLGKSNFNNTYGEVMEFRHTSPDSGVLPPQYVFRGTSTTTDIYFNDGVIFNKTLLLSDYLHVTRKDTTVPATFLILPATNYTSYDFWQVHTSLGTSFSIGAVSAAGGVNGYYLGVTSGSFQIKTANQDRITVTNSGLVGVGTSTPVTRLEVSGGLRISMESATCTVSFAGTLRYSLGNVEYCNGTSWQAFGTGDVTSSSVVSALGYTPADVSTTTILTTAINNLTTSMFNIATSATTMSTSIDGLTASMAAVTSSQWVTNGSTINYMGGNVGIGTTTPASKLTVKGTRQNTITPTNSILQVGGDDVFLYMGAGNGIGNPYPIMLQAMRDSDSAAFPMLLNPNGGNVGVGTSSPAAALHVGGSAGIIITERNSGDAFGAHHVFQKSRGSPVAPTIISSGDEITTLWARAYDGSAYQTSARIKMLVDGVPGASDTPGRIEFTTTPDGTSTEQTRMVIKNDGFVGIGTNTPTRKLHIKDQYPYLAFEDTENASGSIGTITYNQDGYFYFDADNPDTGTDSGFRFRANGGTKQLMAITNSGNVGIGTVTPSAKLEISNSVSPVIRVLAGTGNGVDDDNLLRMMPQNSSGEGGHLEFKGSASNQDWTIDTVGGDLRIFEPGQSRNSVKTRGGITFAVNTSLTSTPSVINDALKISSAGNIGVGTGTPAAKLDIFGSTYFASRKGYANYYNVGPYDQMEFGSMGANTSLSLVTSGVSRLNITPAGYVGVNTTSPETNLQLGPSGYFGIPANGYPYIPGAWRRGNGGGIIMANAQNADGSGWAYGSRVTNHDYGNGLALSFDTLHNGTWTNDVLVVSGRNGSANVGVGTALPSEKLHVVGNLRVQGSTDCTLGNGAGGTNCSSDARLKENIKPIPYALEKIISLKGVEFDWNQKSLSHGRHDIGVIAQDVEKVFPTAVMNDKNTGYKKVDYAVLVAPIIQAFKEFYSFVVNRLEKQDRQIASKADSVEVQALKIKTEKLEAENLQLKQRNEAIQSYLCSQNPSAPFCK